MQPKFCVLLNRFFFSKLIISERHDVDIFYTEFTKITHAIWKIRLEIYLYLQVTYDSLRGILGRSSLRDNVFERPHVIVFMKIQQRV